MHGDHEKAPLPPLVLTGAHLCIVGGVVWLLLGDGLAAVDRATPFSVGSGLWARRMLLAALSFLYLLRLAATSYLLLPRRMDWSEVATVIPWLAFIHAAFALLGGSNPDGLGPVTAVGFVLYLAGSYMNTASEWSRMRWKRSPEHAGHLYTHGLFSHAVHINYFGDILLFTGFALVAGRWGALIVPLLMTASFAFVHVPVLDAYLAERYGPEFRAYAEHTKKLIPGVW